MKATKIFAAAAIFSLATAGSALAFHSGGVGECEGCHSMHNSFEGSANVSGMAQYQSGPYLLKASDQSGSCLNCHEGSPGSYHISTPGINPEDSTIPAQLTPGGDFAWLKKTMTGSIRKTATTWDGERHGHNIIAADFGYVGDTVLTTAPGGSYPAANLACSSCHDPHGRYRRLNDGTQATTGAPIYSSGSYTSSPDPTTWGAVGVYRILAGVGYQPMSTPGFPFANAAPDAVVASSYNRTEAATQTAIAYGQGMSEWCANCHTAMHMDTYTSGTPGLVHPAGNGAALTAAIATNYNDYVSSGIMSAGSGGFSTLAPYEVGTGVYSDLKAFAATPTAASTANNVSCLSCHRAHASAFESMARYYLGNEFMTIADASGNALYDSSTTENKINTGYSVAQQEAAYNGRAATTFGPYARNYCNKCHAKD